MENYLYKVIPYVPKCPEVIAEQKILEAAIALCTHSFCWRKEITDTISAASEGDETSTYSITLDTEAELVSVPVCKRDDIAYSSYYLSGTDLVVPAMMQDTEIYIIAAQKPEKDAEELPSGFTSMQWEEWDDAMAAMAQALLFSMTGQPWHNPNEAAVQITKFNNGVGKIRRQIQQPNPMCEMRIQLRPFV